MRKLNIGIVLTVIVILAVVLFNVFTYFMRKEDKVNVLNACKKYIDFEDSIISFGNNAKFPLELNDYEKHLVNTKDLLKYYMVNDQNYINRQYEIIKVLLDRQYEKKICTILEVNSSISGIKTCQFINDNVTVELKVNVNVKYNIRGEEKIESVSATDVLELQKEDGEWKVKYAKLQYIEILEDDIMSYYM